MTEHGSKIPAAGQGPSEAPSIARVMVPPLEPHEGASWGRGQALALAEVGCVRNDPLSLDLLAGLLHALAVERRPEGFSSRAIIVPGMERAPIAFDLAFVPARDERLEALDRMLGTGEENPLGGDTADISLNGVDGRQVMRFAFRDPDTGHEGETGDLWVTVGVACRRDIATVGPIDILAAADTSQVETLLEVLPSVYDLVTGDELVDAMQRTEQTGASAP